MGRTLLLLIAPACAAVSLHAQRPGTPAPEFALATLDGDTARLSAHVGRPVLINFWASWCTPCRNEMPLLIAAHQAHEQDGLAILAIDLTDQERSIKDARAFVEEFRVPFPVLLDQRGKTRTRYALRGVPTSVFVGADGVVRAVNQGPIDGAALQRHLAEILPR
jgi:cytochrome c biogenesis protein CcmG, thiol:disulfide interchange protein DsbE